MKPLTLVCFGLFVAAVVLWVLEIWFQLLGEALFAKIQITLGALFVVCFVWGFLAKENKATERINKGNGLD